MTIVSRDCRAEDLADVLNELIEEGHDICETVPLDLKYVSTGPSALDYRVPMYRVLYVEEIHTCGKGTLQ